MDHWFFFELYLESPSLSNINLWCLNHSNQDFPLVWYLIPLPFLNFWWLNPNCPITLEQSANPCCFMISWGDYTTHYVTSNVTILHERGVPFSAHRTDQKGRKTGFCSSCSSLLTQLTVGFTSWLGTFFQQQTLLGGQHYWSFHVFLPSHRGIHPVL